MTTLAAPASIAPSSAVVLEAARQAQARARQAEVDLAIATLAWCDLHATPSPTPYGFWPEGLEALDGTDVELLLTGPGAPGVGEFALIEYAAALGMSTDAGRHYVGDLLELHHRLPLLWSRLIAGEVPLWQARRVARTTKTLHAETAAYLDRQIELVAGRIGPTQLARLVEAARALHEPGLVEDERLAALEQRHLTIDTRGGDTLTASGAHPGVVHVEAVLDLPDARDLESAISRIAGELAAEHPDETLDVRRAKALGVLARRDTAHALSIGTARQTVLHVHLSDRSGVNGQTPLARVEGLAGPVSLEAVAEWCRADAADPHTRVVVKPVLDLAAAVHVEAYEVPDRLREQVALRDHTCVFPWCTRPARGCDTDHITPHNRGSPTSTFNLAALCRRHHRAKTHGGWTYRPLDPITDPGSYTWTSPSGDAYLRTPRGTTRVDVR